MKKKNLHKQDLKFDTSWQKERRNKMDQTTSNSMDTISTYPNHRTINELKSLFDLLEEIIFRISLWMALKTLVAGRETLLWIILFLSFQK